MLVVTLMILARRSDAIFMRLTSSTSTKDRRGKICEYPKWLLIHSLLNLFLCRAIEKTQVAERVDLNVLGSDIGLEGGLARVA